MAGTEQADGGPASLAATPAAGFSIEADGSRKRVLAGPIRAHGGQTIAEILLRKPRHRDIIDFGDPEALIVVAGGMVPQVDMTVIERYIVRLSGIDPGLLEQIDYTDTLALRDAVKSFF